MLQLDGFAQGIRPGGGRELGPTNLEHGTDGNSVLQFGHLRHSLAVLQISFPAGVFIVEAPGRLFGFQCVRLHPHLLSSSRLGDRFDDVVVDPDVFAGPIRHSPPILPIVWGIVDFEHPADVFAHPAVYDDFSANVGLRTIEERFPDVEGVRRRLLMGARSEVSDFRVNRVDLVLFGLENSHDDVDEPFLWIPGHREFIDVAHQYPLGEVGVCLHAVFVGASLHHLCRLLRPVDQRDHVLMFGCNVVQRQTFGIIAVDEEVLHPLADVPPDPIRQIVVFVLINATRRQVECFGRLLHWSSFFALELYIFFLNISLPGISARRVHEKKSR
jgi:hypothetical protein